MSSRLFTCAVALAICFSGCAHPPKKDSPAEAAKKKKAEAAKTAMKDVSSDTSFQAFVGHLRTAVTRKDRAEIAQMLTPDFGYRFDTPPAGETPFDYWDKNNAWPELELLLTKKFSPKGAYMVAPPKFVDDDTYRGYRAGIRLVTGSWKLAYFVSGEDLLQ